LPGRTHLKVVVARGIADAFDDGGRSIGHRHEEALGIGLAFTFY
jgi:hypothetical protein